MQFDDLKILTVDSVLSKKAGVYHISPVELENLVRTKKFANVDKIHRHGIMQSCANHRPKKEMSEYAQFNGFQPLDIDFKNQETARLAKPIVAKFMFKYKWCRNVSLSTSGNGLHIYTYHKPNTLSIDKNLDSLKFEYLSTYEYKSIILWKCLLLAYNELTKYPEISIQALKDCHPVLNTSSLTKNSKTANVVDTSLAQISQAMFITQDENILINEDFEFSELDVSENAISFAYEVDKSFGLDVLKNKFDRFLNRYENHDSDAVLTDDKFKVHNFGSVATITPQSYNNEERFRLAYTLARLHDVKDQGSFDYKTIESLYLQMLSGNPKFNAEKNQWANVFRSAVDRHQSGTAPLIWWALKELRDKHGYEIELQNFKQQTNSEIVREYNTDDKIKSFITTDALIDPMFILPVTHDIVLKADEFISDKTEELSRVLRTGVNYMWARPGIGKTEYIKALSKSGKRVLLVLPYTSIIESKIEKSDLNMHCIYGERKMELTRKPNVCMTFDKFSTIDVDEVSMLFDIVAIDESHLLTCSKFRGLVPANVIDTVKKMNTTVILMSGTPIAEHMFLNFKALVHITKAEPREKFMHFVLAKNSLERLTKLSEHIANSIRSGSKVLFPTNNGNEYVERIIGGVTRLLGTKPKYKYYKRENSFYSFVNEINGNATIGDLDILFCTTYLSVGIDINDKCKFDIIYDEKFTGQEIEQFNCRLRKLDLRSYLYFDKNFADDRPKNITLYEPLDLTITNEHKLEFADVFRLHTTNDNPQTHYDFFRWAFKQPYFIHDKHNGSVTLHETAYKVTIFEDRWREWSIQLNVIATTLKQLGYSIRYTDDSEVVGLDKISDVAIASRQAAQEYRQQKQNHIESMLDLIDCQASFELLISMKSQCVIDSSRWEFVKSTDKKTNEDVLLLLVGNRKIYDDWRYSLYLLSKYYTYDVVKSLIYECCMTGGSLRLSKLKKYTTAIKFFASARDKKLVKSNTFIAKHIFENVFVSDEAVFLSDEQVDELCVSLADIYLTKENTESRSVMFKQRLIQKAKQLWLTITIYDGDSIWSLLKLPRFNTQWAMNTRSIGQIFQLMFSDDIFSSITQTMLDENEISRRVSIDVLSDFDTTTTTDVVYEEVKEEFDYDAIEKYNAELDSIWIQQQLAVTMGLEAQRTESDSKVEKAKDELDNASLADVDLDSIINGLF